MRTDIAPSQRDQSGFVRWASSGADNSTLTITFGSWLSVSTMIFVITLFAVLGLLCLAAPFLAIMPGQPRMTHQAWYTMFAESWLFGAFILYGVRPVWRLMQPSQLDLSLASRSYILRKGFRINEKVWTGTFDDIQKIYIWKRRERGSYYYIYNVIISWTMKGIDTPLWTYQSKRADDPKPVDWAKDFCQELGVPFGGSLVGKFTKTWERP